MGKKLKKTAKGRLRKINNNAYMPIFMATSNVCVVAGKGVEWLDKQTLLQKNARNYPWTAKMSTLALSGCDMRVGLIQARVKPTLENTTHTLLHHKQCKESLGQAHFSPPKLSPDFEDLVYKKYKTTSIAIIIIGQRPGDYKGPISFNSSIFILTDQRLIMTNYRAKDRDQPRLPSEQEMLHELQLEQLQITNIKKQRDIILRVEETICRKDKEITRLNALVEKYTPYYQQYSEIKIQLAETESANRTLAKENQILRREFQQLIIDCEGLTARHKQVESQRDTLVRERHAFDRMNRDIEETFKQYQAQCRLRENDLVRQLQTAQALIQDLKKQLTETKKAKVEIQTEDVDKLKEEGKLFRAELAEKQRELLKYKKLNNQLSVQFDKSVSKIVQFERELNDYRRDNHELKKTLGLILQQEKYQKLHEKYLKHRSKSGSREEESEQQDEQNLNQSSQERYVGQSSPSMSQVKY